MLRRLCPHLTRPVQFFYPLTRRVWERAYVGSGIALYDLLALLGRNPLPRHRHWGKNATADLVPALAPNTHRGGITYYDAQVDDARHTITVARTAKRYGALMASSARVVGLLRDGDRVIGAVVRDLESGTEHHIKARQIINATGVWTDHIQDMAGGSSLRVRASKGVHLVVAKDKIESETGLICRTPTSVLFVIPWGSFWLVGTTDTDWNLDLAHPAASKADLDYLLGQANRWLSPGLTHDDIIGVYAGLRPLLSGEDETTSKLSREHAVSTVAPGLISVAGGKYTTYRVMAVDAVDAAVEAMGSRHPKSCTDQIPLVGAEGYQAIANRAAELAERAGMTLDVVEHLLGRYGSETPLLLDQIVAVPALGERLPGTGDYLAVEVWHATIAEGALHLTDVLTRRTRLSIETVDRAVGAAPVAAAIMGEVLGWTAATVKAEIDNYRRRVEAERDSQLASDDRTADAKRLGASDVRVGAD
jgi:glycerol-3-phosphate dehydrogenase